MRTYVRLIAVLTFAAALNACAHVPYDTGAGSVNPDNVNLRENEQQIESGRPYRFLDFAGSWINPFSLINKILLWNPKVQNHSVSEETRSALQQYLIDNNLTDVKVRINQYAPGAEWSRLFRNRAVGGGWRYTLGILSVTFYTILPDRFFGSDNYNPFTHTVNIYSDLPSVAIHEGGHAKDFEAQKWRGTYAALGILPFTSLWFEAQATGDAIGYMRENDLREMEKEGYRVLYPAYATYISGEATGFTSYFTPIDPWVELAIKAGAVIPAHIIGRVKAAEVGDHSTEARHTADNRNQL